MKNAFFRCLLLGMLAAGSYAAGRLWKEKNAQTLTTASQPFDNGFRPAEFVLEERPFVLCLIGYNNGAVLEKSLRSIFSQAYQHYRLIYIDDASSDGSAELARECIEESGEAERCTFLQNAQKLGLAASLRRAAGCCKDEEILVLLGHGEQLAHQWVFHSLNRYFADPDLWLAFGQMHECPSYRPGSVRALCTDEWDKLRSCDLSFGLRVFYTALFKKIDEADLSIEGSDLAVMFPLLEMARDHFQFIPETLTLLWQGSCQEKDLKAERQIRALKPYEPLSQLVGI